MATSGNHSAGKREGLPLNFEGTRTDETTVAKKNVHAQGREALHRIVGAEVSPQAPQAFHNGNEIDPQVTVMVHPIPARIPYICPGSGAAQQGLTWHAAVVQALAPHEGPSDQTHARPQAGTASRSNEAGRAGTDDHQIIWIAWDRIAPIAGMRLRQQAGIVRVFWQDLDSADCGMRDNGHIRLLRVAGS